jgi:hypothetical protein
MFPVSNEEKRAAETLLRSSGKKQRVSAAAVLTAIAFHRIKDGMYVSARAAGDDIGLSSRQRQELRRQVAGWHGTTKTLDQTPRELLRDWQRPQPGQTCRCVWRRRVSQHRHRRACQVWGCLLPRVWHRRQCPRLRRSARMCYGQRGRELMR